MTRRSNERVAYHNGEIKPESRVLVSFRDRGFKFGEAVFDTARTIRHKPFKLGEGIAACETDLDLFDAFTCDECFLTSTSLCMVPVSSINSRPVGGGEVPGPVTARLVESSRRLLDFDFVAQYTSKL